MKYDAFISYKHSEPDMFVAKKVHKGLESFKVPRLVAQKGGKKKIERVFRDQEELPIGSDLGDNIKSALKESEYLIVICSPRTPESYWVQVEIETFIKLHDRTHILAVLVEGEPNESFPKILLEDEEGNPVEPLAADVRGRSKSEIQKKLKTELMRLAAPILHCAYDDLRQRHREQKMRKTVLMASGVAALSVAFALYSAYNTALIQQNFREKQINQSRYLADTALQLLSNGDRQTAALVALEALPGENNDRPHVAEAQYALSQTLRCYDIGTTIGIDRCLKHELPLKDFVFHQDGERILSIDRGQQLYVWNAKNGILLYKQDPELDENGYAEIPIAVDMYEDMVVVCQGQLLYAVDYEGNIKWKIPIDDYLVNCEMDPANDVLACNSNSTLYLYRMSDGVSLGSFENTQEESFSLTSDFSDSGKLFAVSHYSYSADKETGAVTVCNLETGMAQVITTQKDYIEDLTFTPEDKLAVVSSAGLDNYDIFSVNEEISYVELIDVTKQEVLWCNEVQGDPNMVNGLIRINSRKYTEGTTIYNQVMLVRGQEIYTWNAGNGEIQSQLHVSSAIKAFLVAKDAEYGYVADETGVINIVSLNDGTEYTMSAIHTDKYILDVSIKKGICAVRASSSPELYLYSYHEGAGLTHVQELDDMIGTVKLSPEEGYYGVLNFARKQIRFYRSEDDSFVSEWKSSDDAGMELASWYADDDTYVSVSHSGLVTFFDIDKGKERTLQIEGYSFIDSCRKLPGSDFAVIYTRGDYFVLDGRKEKIVCTGHIEDYIFGATLSMDGRYMYCATRDNGVCIVETQTGAVIPMGDEYRVINNTQSNTAFVVSSDDRYVAVCCADGMVRIYDMTEKRTVDQIAFVSDDTRSLFFLKDNRHLLMQGDDYYFRIYDLEQKDFIAVSREQYNTIKDVVVDEALGLVCLVKSSGITMLNSEDYALLADVDQGVAYLRGQAEVICASSFDLYKFPYMTMPMLYEEAKKQFGDFELTALERKRYNVD